MEREQKGRRRTEIKRVDDDQSRSVTFCKRRKGLFSKAEQLHKLTGAQVAVLVFSHSGRAYVSPSFDATVNRYLKASGYGSGSDSDDSISSPSSSTGTTTATGGPDFDAVVDWTNWVDRKLTSIEAAGDLDELLSLRMELESVRDRVVGRLITIEEEIFLEYLLA